MKALIIVDVQNDFCPGGALAVKDGDAVIPIINRLMESRLFDYIVTTQDYHPENTVHFEQWPVHCVAGTRGAELHPDLNTDFVDDHLLKGLDDADDGYSGFEVTDHIELRIHNKFRNDYEYDQDYELVQTQLEMSLDEIFEDRSIDEVYVVGLATDYCVLHTVLDSLKHNFDTYVISDAIRAVNLNVTDGNDALRRMNNEGATIVTSDTILNSDFEKDYEYDGYDNYHDEYDERYGF